MTTANSPHVCQTPSCTLLYVEYQHTPAMMSCCCLPVCCRPARLFVRTSYVVRRSSDVERWARRKKWLYLRTLLPKCKMHCPMTTTRWLPPMPTKYTANHQLYLEQFTYKIRDGFIPPFIFPICSGYWYFPVCWHIWYVRRCCTTTYAGCELPRELAFWLAVCFKFFLAVIN